MAGWCFFLGTLVSSTNKTEHHDITEILLKMAPFVLLVVLLLLFVFIYVD